MKKYILFLTFSSLVSTSLSSIAAQYQEDGPAATTEYTDVEYTPGAYRSYYDKGAPWYGSYRDRSGYHQRHADTPYQTGWHDKWGHRNGHWRSHDWRGKHRDRRHGLHRRHHGKHLRHHGRHHGHHSERHGHY